MSGGSVHLEFASSATGLLKPCCCTSLELHADGLLGMQRPMCCTEGTHHKISKKCQGSGKARPTVLQKIIIARHLTHFRLFSAWDLRLKMSTWHVEIIDLQSTLGQG